MINKTPTYEEVMEQEPIFISECDGYLYVWLHHKDHYDNTIWKVNKTPRMNRDTEVPLW